VCFDNSPFTVDREVLLDCQYGPHYWKEKKKKNKQLRLQSSRKKGCCAHIKLRYYTVHKEYQLCDTGASTMNSRQLRNKKENVLKELRGRIAAGKVKGEEYCHISLPTLNAHTDHIVREIPSYSQRIHPILITKIAELVVDGITDVQEICKMLRNYVKHTVSVQLSISPSHTDKSFYPMPCDIRNHVSKAKRALQLSKLDQENLKLKIEEWQKSTPSSNHFLGLTLRSLICKLIKMDKKVAVMMYSPAQVVMISLMIVPKHFCGYTEKSGNETF